MKTKMTNNLCGFKYIQDLRVVSYMLIIFVVFAYHIHIYYLPVP